eukprot:31513_1
MPCAGSPPKSDALQTIVVLTNLVGLNLLRAKLQPLAPRTVPKGQLQVPPSLAHLI